jgi:general secretion pathway protein H
MTNSASSSPHGFTLLELLVVLAIMAIVAFSVPFIGHGGTELRGLGHELAAELRQLRQTAVRGHAVTEFILEPQRGGYRIGEESLALPPGVSLTYTVSEPPLIGEALDHLAFYPDGSSTGGTLTVSRGDVLVTVRIGWMDGRIVIDG